MHRETDQTPNVIAPPPLIYLGLIAAGVILDSFRPLPLNILPLQGWTGATIMVAGFILSARSVIEFLRNQTHPDPRRPTTTVITSGPFRFSRNPIYLAFALMHVGLAVWSAKAWLLITLLPALAAIRYGVIGPEERYLEQKFGPVYLDYKKSVRRWL